MVDCLFMVAADGVDQVDQRAGEQVGRVFDPRFSCGVHGRVIGFGVACRAGVGLDLVGINRIEQIADDASKRAARHFRDLRLIGGVQFGIQPRQA